jgi:hypothetical protein
MKKIVVSKQKLQEALAASGKNPAGTNGKTPASASGKTPAGASGKTPAGASGKTPASASGKTSASTSGKTPASANGKTPASASGKTAAGANGKTAASANGRAAAGATGSTTATPGSAERSRKPASPPSKAPLWITLGVLGVIILATLISAASRPRFRPRPVYMVPVAETPETQPVPLGKLRQLGNKTMGEYLKDNPESSELRRQRQEARRQFEAERQRR